MGDLMVYHHVNELLKIFEVREKGNESFSANAFSEMLLKNRVPNVTVPVQGMTAAKTLADTSSTPESFMKKYESLQMKNWRELDSTVSLLSQIATDKKFGVKHFLKRHAEHRAKNMATANVRPAESLSELKQQLVEKITEAQSGYNELELSSEKRYLENAYNRPTIMESSWIQDGLTSWDFAQCKSEVLGCLGELPVSVQKNRLIDDLLFCLAGINGEYIHSLPLLDPLGSRDLVIDDTCDPSLQEFVKRILPLAKHYSIVIRFIEEHTEYKYGLVNNALAGAMRLLLKDYFILLAQLEHQHQESALSLEKMWFYLQPTMKNMEMLSYVSSSISHGQCHGGTVLSVLHRILTSQTGDPKLQELLLFLLQTSCTPFFEMLENWIYKGIIVDTYMEFLVVDNDSDKRKEMPFISDEYWAKRYTICRDKIPLFLEKVADKILRTGKYWNVIQQCGHDIKCPRTEKIVYSMTERQYIEQMEVAYNYASKMLLKMLMEDCDLMGRLRSLKHYFLMDQGDFIVQFLDMAKDELKKDIDEIVPSRLEFLQELALRTSVVNSDKYKDDVGVDILQYDLRSQMFKILRLDEQGNEEFGVFQESFISGMEAFAFKYKVDWPLSLVINRDAMARYQMLFRYLFFCKNVERLLGNVWSKNKVAKAYSLDASCCYASAFALRQSMLNFIQNVEYYTVAEVIEPNWIELMKKLQEVSNVDDVLTLHTQFLKNCLDDCMLTIPDLLTTMVKLLKLCISFANFMKQTHKGAVEAELGPIDQSYCAQISNPNSLENETDDIPQPFRVTINDYHQGFHKLLFELLQLIRNHDKKNQNSDKMVNMWYRIDFNNFYIKQLQSQMI